MIDVNSKVRVYEVNGKEVEIGKTKSISVSSHWNYSNWVVLKVGNRRLTVVARDLIEAIKNATNTAKY